MEVPQGRFALTRPRLAPRSPLRAWDAADEYALTHLAGVPDVTRGAAVVTVNDDFGALTVALAARCGVNRVHHLGDSFVAQRTAAVNLGANGFDPAQVGFHARIDTLPPRIDVVVVRVPKVLDLLDQQLRGLAPRLHPASVVLGTAMAKHLHTSTLEVFERCLGRPRTTLAWHKARLVEVVVDTTRTAVAASSRWPRRFAIESHGLQVVAWPNVFGAGGLDPGTALLLDALAHRSAPAPVGDRLVDLGCGTGVVGAVEALRLPTAHVRFVDESFQAVASAEATFRATCGPDRRADFVVGDGLDAVLDGDPLGAGTVDRVIVNPPFHTGHAVTDAVAWEMFVETRRALARGGDVWVVGNRHLGYHVKLKRVFGNAELRSSSPSYVVLRSVRR